MDKVKELTTNLVQNIEKVIIGKRRAIQLVVLGLICEGHVLIEDVPGVGSITERLLCLQKAAQESQRAGQ